MEGCTNTGFKNFLPCIVPNFLYKIEKYVYIFIIDNEYIIGLGDKLSRGSISQQDLRYFFLPPESDIRKNFLSLLKASALFDTQELSKKADAWFGVVDLYHLKTKVVDTLVNISFTHLFHKHRKVIDRLDTYGWQSCSDTMN